jgi:predicted dehydrogenase
LIAGMDTDGKRRDLFAKRWNVAVYQDAHLMLKEQRPQILVVATDPDSHAEYCRTAAHAGVPLVICEKPRRIPSKMPETLRPSSKRESSGCW